MPDGIPKYRLTVGERYKLKYISNQKTYSTTETHNTLISISYEFSHFPKDPTKEMIYIPINQINIEFNDLHFCDTQETYECLYTGKVYNIEKNGKSIGTYKLEHICYIFDTPLANKKTYEKIEVIDNENSPDYEITPLGVNNNRIQVNNDSYKAVEIPREIPVGGRRKTRKAKKTRKARKVKKTRKH